MGPVVEVDWAKGDLVVVGEGIHLLRMQSIRKVKCFWNALYSNSEELQKLKQEFWSAGVLLPLLRRNVQRKIERERFKSHIAGQMELLQTP